MLQRKQTLWMFLAVVCAVLTFWIGFYGGDVPIGQSGHEYRELRAWPTYVNGASGSILIFVVTLALIIGIGYNIFNYKARTKQFWWTIGLFVLSLINILLYWQASRPPAYTKGAFNLGALLSIAIPVLLVMAARGIRKDERLIKSADRLR